MTPTRGPFIVIEGLDRSGKSTQAARLLSRLEKDGHKVKLVKFPDRTTPIGTMIDAYLRSKSELDDHAIHLLFSANRWELASSIEADLKAGHVVICDRYAFSGCAFTASKGLPYDWCLAPDIGLPSPDIVLFLDVSPAVAKSRGGYGDERYEKEEMQKLVRQIFHQIGREFGNQWKLVDADQTLEEVEDTIWTELQPLLRGVAQPIAPLWSERTGLSK